MKCETILKHAEDVNYWKTSRTAPDTWLEKAKREIKRAGGQVLGSGSMTDDVTGRAGFMIAFVLDSDRFALKWPVLQSKSGDLKAARVQAATALYREVKAACVKAKFLGSRAAFFAYLQLPDGRTAAEATMPELVEALPAAFAPALLIPAVEGEIIEGRYNET